MPAAGAGAGPLGWAGGSVGEKRQYEGETDQLSLTHTPNRGWNPQPGYVTCLGSSPGSHLGQAGLLVTQLPRVKEEVGSRRGGEHSSAKSRAGRRRRKGCQGGPSTARRAGPLLWRSPGLLNKRGPCCMRACASCHWWSRGPARPSRRSCRPLSATDFPPAPTWAGPLQSRISREETLGSMMFVADGHPERSLQPDLPGTAARGSGGLGAWGLCAPPLHVPT